ncbi:MAG: iron-containing alcohol dehydrogenase [Sandaracinaceae bacterium]
MTHNIEAYCAKATTRMADAIAPTGIELCAKHPRRRSRTAKNVEGARRDAEGVDDGAVAFQKGLGACHALALTRSVRKEWLACTTASRTRFACRGARLQLHCGAEGIARIARILGVKGNDIDTLAFECSGAVRALRKQVGLPNGLAEAGVTDEQLPVPRSAQADYVHGPNPRPCTQDDARAFHRASM